MASQAQFSPQLAFSSGVIAAGAKAYFYETGTTTPVTVYSDAALTTPHADPLVANSAGEFAQVFYGGGTALKAVIKTSAGATIATIDPVPLVTSTGSAADAISFSPVAGNAATDVQTAIENITTTANGLGTISTQNGNAVAITGGTIDGVSVGSTTPAAGAFTTLGATGAITLGATAWASLFLDEDDMASDSATKAPSQQSVKAHVATEVAGGNKVKAWVNFNGTGTVAISASLNVSSITDNGTGDYTVNFTSALADANYAVGVTAQASSSQAFGALRGGGTYSTTAVQVATATNTTSLADCPIVDVIVVR